LFQAYAGLLWSKQWFHYDVHRWLAGDRGQPRPPASRRGPQARNSTWAHMVCSDIISMPDKWEYVRSVPMTGLMISSCTTGL
jgi:hypothetical protein